MRNLALRLFIDAESTKAVRIWSRTRESRGYTLFIPQKGPVYATLSSQVLACSRPSAIPRMHTNATADHCRCADLESNAVHDDERGLVLQNIGNTLGGQSRGNIHFERHPFGQRSGRILFRYFARDSMASVCFSIIAVLYSFFFLLSLCSLMVVSRGVFRRNVASPTPAQLQPMHCWDSYSCS